VAQWRQTSAAIVISVLLRRHANALDFLAAAQTWLARAESSNNLLLSFASRRALQAPTGESDYYATVREGYDLCLAATASAHGGVLLAGTDARALRELAQDIAKADLLPQGVVGEPRAAEEFAACFCANGKAEIHLRHRLKHLSLLSLPLPPALPGMMRAAEPGDLALIEHWWEQFRQETRAAGHSRDLIAAVESRIPGRGVVLWCAPEPVAMAAYTLLLPDAARISAVYVAPQSRQQGFASALVAELSRQIMLRGMGEPGPRRACFLSTDASNPVSNAIYERVGYKMQGEHLHLDFIYPAEQA